MKNNIYDEVINFIEDAKKDFASISVERKSILLELSKYIRLKHKSGDEINLIFICTHNSRRSHMGQIWAKVAADFYKIPNVNTFSGGTEATAFNPRAVKSFESAGFRISKSEDLENPVYQLRFSDSFDPIINFSKVYDDETNPKNNFAAIMTCDHADEACPFIPGAEARFPVMYEDPKKFDDTDLETEKYNERNKQICSEILFVFENSF